MRTSARTLCGLLLALSLGLGCGDDDAPRPLRDAGADANTPPDGEVAPPDAGTDASVPEQDASTPRSLLPRPGRLPRPPAGKLPDDLKPPVR